MNDDSVRMNGGVADTKLVVLVKEDLEPLASDGVAGGRSHL